MTLRTAVIDTADWHLAIPLQATGGSPDFSDTLLTIALTPILGGTPIATADSEAGTLVFVPASGSAPAYFALDLRVKDRTWRIAKPTQVVGDVLRHPDSAFPLYTEWLGRVSLTVHPGSNSTGLASPGYAPVLTDAQPYDGRIVSTPMILGPQGAPGSGGNLPDFAMSRSGDGPVVVWALEDDTGAPFDTAGRSFVLSARWNNGSLTRDTLVDAELAADAGTSRVMWTPTPSDRQAIPLGPSTFFDLSCRVGAQLKPILSGIISGTA